MSASKPNVFLYISPTLKFRYVRLVDLQFYYMDMNRLYNLYATFEYLEALTHIF